MQNYVKIRTSCGTKSNFAEFHEIKSHFPNYCEYKNFEILIKRSYFKKNFLFPKPFYKVK